VLDLPGQLEQELVGYPVRAASLYLRRNVVPSWAKLALVVRNERVLSPAEAGAVRDADYAYFLAPPDRARALDRFFVDAPAPAAPDQRLLGDFFVPSDATLGALAEIYGVAISPEDAATSLADYFQAKSPRGVTVGDRLPLGAIELIADRVESGRVATVGLDLAEPHARDTPPASALRRLYDRIRRAVARR
jgi:cell volume regulation protein A